MPIVNANANIAKLATPATPTPAVANPLALAKRVEPLRLLIYGKPKTRKTWFACTAAETHNVYVLNADNGLAIANNMLPDSILANITNVPLAVAGASPTTANFLAQMFKEEKFNWDIDAGEEATLAKIKQQSPDKVYAEVNLSHFTTDDVVIIDSWTRIVSDVGMRYMQGVGDDVFEGRKRDFDFYGYQMLALDRILTAINTLPCHVILIAHEVIHETKIINNGVSQKVDKIQVLSSTTKHSAKVAAQASDILYFTSEDNGLTSHITSRSSSQQEGGGRTLFNIEATFPTWSFKDLLKAANLPVGKLNPTDRPRPIQGITGAELIAKAPAVAPVTMNKKTKGTKGNIINAQN